MSKIIIALDRLHWLWLVLAAPFLLFPTPKRSLAMLVIPALLFLHWLAERAKRSQAVTIQGSTESYPANIIPSTPLNVAILLLFVMVLVSLGVTYDINYSLPKITGMVLAFGIFFEVVRFAQKPRDWLFCVLAFLLIGLGMATVGLFGTAWFANARLPVLSPLIDRVPRLVTGLQGAESGFHPNEVAGALLWILPVMAVVSSMMIVAFIKIGKGDKGDPVSSEEKGQQAFGQKKRRGWLLAGTLVSLFAFFFMAMVFLLSQSRGGLIALIAASFLILLISLPSKIRWYGFALALVALIIFSYVVLTHGGTVQTWLMGNNLASASTFSISSFRQRIEIWSRAIAAIRDFPFTGMGMNVFRKVLPQLYPIFSFPQNFDIGHAHNELLQSALDLGIPGLIAFLALYIGAFWMLVKLWVLSLRPSTVISSSPLPGLPLSVFLRASVIGLGGGLLAHLCFGFTDAIALGAKPGLLFWMLLALISSLYVQVYSGSKSSETLSTLKAS